MTPTRSTAPFQLYRDAFGHLVLTRDNGERHDAVTPVRAFPIADPDAGIALISAEGHEIAWADRLDDLPPEIAALIREELASREFVPEIEQIVSVSGFACPSAWQLRTSRGACTLLLKAEEDIRRLSRTQLLIADSHGVQFLVRDLTRLDRHSRKLLDRFL